SKMDQLYDKAIIKMLKTVGFQGFNRKALEYLKNITAQKMTLTLKYLSSLSNHSQKANTTLLDIFKLLEQAKVKLRKEDVQSFEPLNLEYERFEVEKPFENPLATAIEKYIHIYDFMPDFPPTHTFRRTFIKEIKKEDKAAKLKKRLEQTAIAQENLIKMLKQTNNIPDHANFMETFE
ncbi:hypothetical protein EDEG_04244, partial [Edhazardia aedis USNM 41457]